MITMRSWFLLLVILVTLPAAAAAADRNFAINDRPKALPGVRFVDGESHDRALADFSGKVVLLNVWATWCVPCRKEMPTLDRLQRTLGGKDFQVVALSIDRQGAPAVRKFYSDINIKHLDMYVDSSGKAVRDRGAVGLPTTLLVYRAGHEIGRLVGPAEWDTPGMLAFIRRHIGQQFDRP